MLKKVVVLPFSSLVATALLLAVPGCRVENEKKGNNDDVKIATPFGGMSVKTNDAVDEGSVGISVYPGATLVKKDKDKDDSAADVNMSFGAFHLGVKAISYQTPDPPDKVTDFYRKDLARYGTVILCHNHKAVGQPDHTQDGLTCDTNGHGSHVRVDDDESGDELKTGSRLHQHLVAMEQKNGGTRIGLIALDLPGDFGKGSDERQ